MTEKLYLKKGLGAALACAGALALGGCEGSNTDGSGNDFTIRGPVIAVGKHSLRMKIATIVKAEGQADDWFDDGKEHQVHDNYRDCDFWGDLDLHNTGEEFNKQSNAETLRDVQPGEWVELTGKIRDSYSECDSPTDKYDSDEYELRPVYDQLREVPS